MPADHAGFLAGAVKNPAGTGKVQAEGKVRHPLSNLSKKLAALPIRYAKPISVATLVVALISIVLAFNVKTDFNPIDLRDPNTESVIAFKKLMEDEETTPMTLNVLAKDENSTKILQQKLSALASVGKTVSLFDLQPTDQDEKLALIEDLALMLGPQVQHFPQLKTDADPAPGITHLIETIDSLLPQKTNARDRAVVNELEKGIAGNPGPSSMHGQSPAGRFSLKKSRPRCSAPYRKS